MPFRAQEICQHCDLPAPILEQSNAIWPESGHLQERCSCSAHWIVSCDPSAITASTCKPHNEELSKRTFKDEAGPSSSSSTSTSMSSSSSSSMRLLFLLLPCRTRRTGATGPSLSSLLLEASSCASHRHAACQCCCSMVAGANFLPAGMLQPRHTGIRHCSKSPQQR